MTFLTRGPFLDLLGLEEGLPDDGVARDGLFDDPRHQVPSVDARVDLDRVALRSPLVTRDRNRTVMTSFRKSIKKSCLKPARLAGPHA